MKKPKDRASLSYLKCIVFHLLGKNTAEAEAEFERYLAEDFESTWSTEEIEAWLPTADITPEQRKFIEEKTELLKQKRAKGKGGEEK